MTTLTYEFVTDLPNVYMVADPFVVKSGDTFYLFFEASYDNGVNQNVEVGNYCCYATSPDGVNWTYGAKITSLPGGNYCQVFLVDETGNPSKWYVCPHMSDKSVDLYECLTFPTLWQFYKRLFTSDNNLYDATVFQYGGYWWILCGEIISGVFSTSLYYSSHLITGTWSRHPTTLLTGSDKWRPGGRPIVRASSVDIYMQNGSVTYGGSLRAYRLTNLTISTVTVTELDTSPILTASGSGWNKDGMHNLDRVSPTVSLVDGKETIDGNDVWSIGIYQDA